MDELFETEDKKPQQPKQIGHLHRKLFLLVFALALLAQGWLLGGKGLSGYYQALLDDFKVILTVEEPAKNAQLEEWGQTLNQKQDILSVQLFSPEDALAVVRQKNPQLAESLLQIGKNQMPAYFELKLSPAAISNIGPFIDNLGAEYSSLVPHYHASQARFISYTGYLVTGMRVIGGLALLALLAFMFLVEAAPYTTTYAGSGALSGILAAVAAAGCVAAVLYPLGLLYDAVLYFTTWGQQLLYVVLCGLLGWALAKWQRF